MCVRLHKHIYIWTRHARARACSTSTGSDRSSASLRARSWERPVAVAAAASSPPSLLPPDEAEARTMSSRASPVFCRFRARGISAGVLASAAVRLCRRGRV